MADSDERLRRLVEMLPDALERKIKEADKSVNKRVGDLRSQVESLVSDIERRLADDVRNVAQNVVAKASNLDARLRGLESGAHTPLTPPKPDQSGAGTAGYSSLAGAGASAHGTARPSVGGYLSHPVAKAVYVGVGGVAAYALSSWIPIVEYFSEAAAGVALWVGANTALRNYRNRTVIDVKKAKNDHEKEEIRKENKKIMWNKPIERGLEFVVRTGGAYLAIKGGLSAPGNIIEHVSGYLGSTSGSDIKNFLSQITSYVPTKTISAGVAAVSTFWGTTVDQLKRNTWDRIPAGVAFTTVAGLATLATVDYFLPGTTVALSSTKTTGLDGILNDVGSFLRAYGGQVAMFAGSSAAYLASRKIPSDGVRKTVKAVAGGLAGLSLYKTGLFGFLPGGWDAVGAGLATLGLMYAADGRRIPGMSRSDGSRSGVSNIGGLGITAVAGLGVGALFYFGADQLGDFFSGKYPKLGASLGNYKGEIASAVAGAAAYFGAKTIPSGFVRNAAQLLTTTAAVYGAGIPQEIAQNLASNAKAVAKYTLAAIPAAGIVALGIGKIVDHYFRGPSQKRPTSA
jgi:hypothetical protein